MRSRNLKFALLVIISALAVFFLVHKLLSEPGADIGSKLADVTDGSTHAVVTPRSIEGKPSKLPSNPPTADVPIRDGPTPRDAVKYPAAQGVPEILPEERSPGPEIRDNKPIVDEVIRPDPTDPDKFELHVREAELEVISPSTIGATKLWGMYISVAGCEYVSHEVIVLSRVPPTNAKWPDDGITAYESVPERDPKQRIVKVRLLLRAKKVDAGQTSIKARLSVVTRCAKTGEPSLLNEAR